eukprot:1119480-Prymnesium_polylepis.2
MPRRKSVAPRDRLSQCAIRASVRTRPRRLSISRRGPILARGPLRRPSAPCAGPNGIVYRWAVLGPGHLTH